MNLNKIEATVTNRDSLEISYDLHYAEGGNYIPFDEPIYFDISSHSFIFKDTAYTNMEDAKAAAVTYVIDDLLNEREKINERLTMLRKLIGESNG